MIQTSCIILQLKKKTHLCGFLLEKVRGSMLHPAYMPKLARSEGAPGWDGAKTGHQPDKPRVHSLGK